MTGSDVSAPYILHYADDQQFLITVDVPLGDAPIARALFAQTFAAETRPFTWHTKPVECTYTGGTRRDPLPMFQIRCRGIYAPPVVVGLTDVTEKPTVTPSQ